jgi:tryptophan 2,3-dioxygenase
MLLRNTYNRKEKSIEATGGSDWRKYMHPRYQRRIFFPDLMVCTRIRRLGERRLSNYEC